MIGVFIRFSLMILRLIDMALLDDSCPQIGQNDLYLWII